jgi:hypothetical protein
MNEDELNEAVAAQVFGYSEPITVYQWQDRKQKKHPFRRFLKCANEHGWDNQKDYNSRATEDGAKILSCYRIAPYSTSIYDAWKVVDAISKELCDFSLEKSGGNWTASWTGFHATDTTPQRAICLAALEYCKAKV